MTLERLGATDLRAGLAAYRDVLRDHREAINRLNVYPVPDGDTGTNMALTLESVLTELRQAEPDMSATCEAVSYGSLMGARGNSGVIISQVLRGLSSTFAAADQVDGPTLATGLVAGADAAYEAVMRPVEGTILTVARAASEGASGAAAGGASLAEVLESALHSAEEALARTPELLPVLARAGVVDAGGAGFVLLLEALLHVVADRPLPEAPDAAGPSGVLQLVQEMAGEPEADGDPSALRYEVMYLLEAPDEVVPAFKHSWAAIGDSIVVVGGSGLWNCHIHTDDIGAAVEAALDCGRPRRIRVTDLQEQVQEERWVLEGVAATSHPEGPLAESVPTAVVAVANGDGVQRIFRSLGVQVVVSGGQSMNPSTGQLLEAVEATSAPEVVILPNNSNILAVAEQVDALTAKQVRVVPTRGIAEGFAALLSYDPQDDVESNVSAMGAAAAQVVAGEITRAVRDSECDVGPIRAGDYLGITGDGILAVDATIVGAATALLDALVSPEHEIVTLIAGEGATEDDSRLVGEWLATHRPGVGVEVHQGGQPLYPYVLGVE